MNLCRLLQRFVSGRDYVEFWGLVMFLTSELINDVNPFYVLPSPKEILSVMFNIYHYLYLSLLIYTYIHIYYISKITTH